MTNSPCAKLMVCEVCHGSVKTYRDDRVDRSGREAGHEKIEQIGHASLIFNWRTGGDAPAGSRARKCRGSIQLRQHLLDDLLALDDFHQKTLAIDVAVLIEGHIHQDARLVRGLDGEAVQFIGERLGVATVTLPIFRWSP